MSFCSNCGKEVNQSAAFCESCGAPVTPSGVIDEEQKFLDQTYKFMRWERIAWKVSGVVFLILGIIYGGLFGLMGLFGVANTSPYNGDGEALAIIGFTYGLIFGGLFLLMGIIGLVSANKIPQYLGSLHANFRPTLNRCGSIGMLVFTALFNEISLIFFLINFVRIKSNRHLIDRILSRQGK